MKEKNKEKSNLQYDIQLNKFYVKLEDDAHGDFGAYVSVYIFIICM